MKTLFTYLKPRLKTMSFGFTIKLAATLLELLLPWMLSVILDIYVPTKNTSMIFIWGGAMIFCSALALYMNVTANRKAMVVSRYVTQEIRGDLFSKILHLSATQEDKFSTPSLISRITSDMYNMYYFVDRMQRVGVRAPIMLLGGVAITIFMEPVLAMVLIGTLPVLALIVWLISSKGVKLYSNTQYSLDIMLRRAQESMAGIRVIQALSKSKYEAEQFEKANTDFAQNQQKADLLMNLSSPLINLILNTGLTLVIIVGAYRVNLGVTQPGAVIAFLSYFTIILNALMMISRIFILYSRGSASAARIEEVLLTPDDMPLLESPKSNNNSFIIFDNVSFSYEKISEDISNISFSIKKGETLGIIGPTGSGKTTILQLLLRLYAPDKGSIYMEGENLKGITPEALYSEVGIVFQNDFLFAGEIAENISFGRNLTEDILVNAAKNAQANFIYEKTDGFKEKLSSKGSNLSGGQKQRLLLARAMAYNPKLLILDDSSSALDYKTDAALRKSLNQEFKFSTKIIVSQRVSSICSADKILVIDGGFQIGYGTHDELMKNCEKYRQIAMVQMGEVK